uniref:Uncharacterized protein n=1 Tax=Vitis vinifera TaxID=29760 RepID=F6HIJ9_VITVI
MAEKEGGIVKKRHVEAMRMAITVLGSTATCGSCKRREMLAQLSEKPPKSPTCIDFLRRILDLNINLIHLWTINNTAAITGNSLHPEVKNTSTGHCSKEDPPPFPSQR